MLPVSSSVSSLFYSFHPSLLICFICFLFSPRPSFPPYLLFFAPRFCLPSYLLSFIPSFRSFCVLHKSFKHFIHSYSVTHSAFASWVSFLFGVILFLSFLPSLCCHFPQTAFSYLPFNPLFLILSFKLLNQLSTCFLATFQPLHYHTSLKKTYCKDIYDLPITFSWWCVWLCYCFLVCFIFSLIFLSPILIL